MITFLLGFLTVILVLTSFLLILLVLIQLPKKDAGPGVAFGGGATEAMFGAGSGSALTKITKYCAATFMGLSLLLAVVNAHRAQTIDRSVDLELERRAAEAQTTQPVAPTPTAPPPGQLQLLTPPEPAPAMEPGPIQPSPQPNP
jgi:preprotein translocase subunit SecG